MRYRAQVGGDVEWLWNSRDGVAPFLVTSRSRLTLLAHLDWSADKRRPLHVPAVGDRIFVDLTLERAREYRQRFVERHWTAQRMELYTDRWASPEEAVEVLARGDYGDGRKPDVVVVDARMHGALVDRFRALVAQVSILAQFARPMGVA